MANKVTRRFRDKAHKAAKKSGAPKRQLKESVDGLPKEKQTDTAEQKPADPENTPEMIFERVLVAHERLQKTMEDCQRFLER